MSSRAELADELAEPLAWDAHSVSFEAVDSDVAATAADVIVADVIGDDVFVADFIADVDGGLFLSNGLIRSDGFNVVDWNLL